MAIVEGTKCKSCEKPITFIDGVGWVHNGGGTTTHICRRCQWTGSQIDGFSSCPSCGSEYDVNVDHVAN